MASSRRIKSIQYKRIAEPVPFPGEIPVISQQPVAIQFPVVRQYQRKSGIETTTFTEKVQLDKFNPSFPNTTNRLKSTPHYYPYSFQNLMGSTFSERTTPDKWDSPTVRIRPNHFQKRATNAYIPGLFRPDTVTFPERVQLDKFKPTYPDTTSRLKQVAHLYPSLFLDWKQIVANTIFADSFQFHFPDTTISKKSTPQNYPYIFNNLMGNTFNETVSLDRFKPQIPDTTSSKKSTPWYYSYIFGDLFPQVPNVNTFKPSNPDSTRSNKPTPPYYPYIFGNVFPQIPQVDGFEGNTARMLPILKRGHLINYMGQPSVIFVNGRVFTLPLLGVG